MASIQLRVCGEFGAAAAALLAIADSVSPRCTTWVPPALDSELAGGALLRAGAGELRTGAGSGKLAAAALAVSALRGIAPSRVPAPVEGALSAAPAAAEGPGVYTGGSSSMVYSRTRCPCDQFTSSSSVINGSEIASVDLSLRTWRPSGVRAMRTCTPAR